MPIQPGLAGSLTPAGAQFHSHASWPAPGAAHGQPGVTALQAEELAAFFDTRTVKTQGGLQAPAILSVQGRNFDVHVRLLPPCPARCGSGWQGHPQRCQLHAPLHARQQVPCRPS